MNGHFAECCDEGCIRFGLKKWFNMQPGRARPSASNPLLNFDVETSLASESECVSRLQFHLQFLTSRGRRNLE